MEDFVEAIILQPPCDTWVARDRSIARATGCVCPNEKRAWSATPVDDGACIRPCCGGRLLLFFSLLLFFFVVAVTWLTPCLVPR